MRVPISFLAASNDMPSKRGLAAAVQVDAGSELTALMRASSFTIVAAKADVAPATIASIARAVRIVNRSATVFCVSALKHKAYSLAARKVLWYMR
jgi:hypothetical protein